MKKLALAAFFLISISSQAIASDLNYNYAHIAYGANVENSSDDGFQIDGSFKFNDNIYGIIGRRWNDYSADTAAGIGFIKSVSEKTDWITEASYIYSWADVWYPLPLPGRFETIDANGYRVATGLRGMASDKVEMVGKINYTDYGNLGNGIGTSIGIVYHVNDSFGITADYEYSGASEVGLWGIGARISF